MTTSRSRDWSARRALAAGMVLALALFAARLWSSRSFDAGPEPMNLADARELPVTLPDGRIGRLGDAIRPGVPTVVSLWASWCGPCRKEAPTIAELRQRFGPGELNLVYLNVRDSDATRADLAYLTQAAGLPADGYVSMKDGDLVQFTNDLGSAIPRTYVFDRAGLPVAMILGYKPMALARVAGLVAA